MSKATNFQQSTFQLNIQYSILVTARSNKVLLMIQIFHEAQILLNNSVSVKRTDFVIQDNLLQSLQIQENKVTTKNINLNKLNGFRYYQVKPLNCELPSRFNMSDSKIQI
ncbi:Hypothetical_protein [Hexamita inflata]|uniref:Hypothetical_protein n=1 Tax=Hexamita inflata TaxID=28002 RepID=A0AA86QSR8_9EUKA|nr:Hypothetical protein HINF_LOCUS50052 [Hexamita inflata]